MNRSIKYPETDSFIYHNQNPHNRITEDCVVRAASLALNITYNECVMELANIACDTGYSVCGGKGEEELFKRHGWVRHKQVRHSNNSKLTGEEFCRYLDAKGFNNVFASIGTHHVVCIKVVNGKHKIHDIWDSSNGCVGVWYTEMR